VVRASAKAMSFMMNFMKVPLVMGFRPWAADAMDMRVLYRVVCTDLVGSIHEKKLASKFLKRYRQRAALVV
jgi:hypothetical protein